MTTLEMGDASSPPVPAANLPVFAFYIGGDTPHVWTDEEIAQLRARWAVPIFVRANPAADFAADAVSVLGWLHDHGWAHGTTVVIDTESVPMDAYLHGLNALIDAGGYRLMNYESKGPMPSNPLTSGGRWVADWTGVPHMFDGAEATQYASSPMIGFPWDASVIDEGVPLHELHPPAVHKIATVKVELALPELSRGDSGPAVRRLQSLLLAWDSTCLQGTTDDGVFGPETASAVGTFQRLYGLQADRGAAGAATWARLVAG